MKIRYYVYLPKQLFMKLLLMLLLVPVLSFSQKGAVLFRAGVNTCQQAVNVRGTLSVLGNLKGLGIGGGVGVEHNRLFNGVAVPMYGELTTLSQSKKLAPLGTFQVGYLHLAEAKQGYTKGGMFMRLLLGARAPGKTAPFMQFGYGVQRLQLKDYGTFIALIGVKF